MVQTRKQITASLVAQRIKRLLAIRETWVRSLGREDPLEKEMATHKWQPTPVLVPGKSHGQRSLVGYSLWGRRESDMTERLHFQTRLGKVPQSESTKGFRI